MPTLTSGVVKRWLKDMGADLVGIAPVERFKGAPPGRGPTDFMPEARSVIAFGVRLPDSVVEYDSYYLNYQDMPLHIGIYDSVHQFYLVMGHFTQDVMLITMAVKTANQLELGWGYKSLPTPNTSYTGLGMLAPVEVLRYPSFFSQRHSAVRAGLGEFGYSNLVLNTEFGPRVRYCSIITEAELELDPIITKQICLREKCDVVHGPRCFRACTPQSLKLKEGIELDAIFMDQPSYHDRIKCAQTASPEVDVNIRGCGFYGTCMRVCPVKVNLKKRKAANLAANFQAKGEKW